MKKILTTIVLALALTIVNAQDNTDRLWYDKPATVWLEALPIGNSHLGGMVYGGTKSDELQLNEETFWSGGPHNNNSKNSLADLRKYAILSSTRRRTMRKRLSTTTSSPAPTA